MKLISYHRSTASSCTPYNEPSRARPMHRENTMKQEMNFEQIFDELRLDESVEFVTDDIICVKLMTREIRKRHETNITTYKVKKMIEKSGKMTILKSKSGTNASVLIAPLFGLVHGCANASKDCVYASTFTAEDWESFDGTLANFLSKELNLKPIRSSNASNARNNDLIRKLKSSNDKITEQALETEQLKSEITRLTNELADIKYELDGYIHAETERNKKQNDFYKDVEELKSLN